MTTSQSTQLRRSELHAEYYQTVANRGIRTDPTNRSDDIAQTLVDAVHRGDQFTIQRILNRPDLRRIAVQLAERLERSPRRLEPCGTRSAAERHIRLGELMDDACADARRAYYREQKRKQAALRRADGASATSGRRTSPTASTGTSTSAVDPVVVERLTNGLHVPSNQRERAEAVRILNSRDVTVSEISRRLHMSGGRVTQILTGQHVRPNKDTDATEVAS